VRACGGDTPTTQLCARLPGPFAPRQLAAGSLRGMPAGREKQEAGASARLSLGCGLRVTQGIPFIALEGEGEHSSFRLTEEAKQFLQTLKAPVALASIVV
jgi:hypothetical protein